MNRGVTPCWALLSILVSGMAAAQQAPAVASPAAAPTKSTAQIDAGEPRATTSPTSGADTAPADAALKAPGVADGPGAKAAARTPVAGAAAAQRPVASRPRGATGAGPKTPAVDRLNLGAATVTGDQEQPKVMYVVPWKKSDIGDLSGKPMNSLLDEALAPVDREEFRREVAYYDAVKADTPQSGASNPASKQGEK